MSIFFILVYFLHTSIYPGEKLGEEKQAYHIEVKADGESKAIAINNGIVNSNGSMAFYGPVFQHYHHGKGYIPAEEEIPDAVLYSPIKLPGFPPPFSAQERSTTRKTFDIDLRLSEDQKIEQLIELVRKIQTSVRNRMTKYPPDSLRVIVLADTGSGKSTFIHALADIPFFLDEGSRTVKPVREMEGFEFVTNVLDSATREPGLWYNNAHNLLFCDCPGFYDSAGDEQDIINAFAIDQLFSARPCRIKVLLLMQEEYFRIDRGFKVLRFFDDVLPLLPKHDGSLVEQSIALVVTQGRSNPREEISLLRAKLERSTRLDCSEESKDLLKFFDDHREDCVFAFGQAALEAGYLYDILPHRERILRKLPHGFAENPGHSLHFTPKMQRLVQRVFGGSEKIVDDLFKFARKQYIESIRTSVNSQEGVLKEHITVLRKSNDLLSQLKDRASRKQRARDEEFAGRISIEWFVGEMVRLFPSGLEELEKSLQQLKDDELRFEFASDIAARERNKKDRFAIRPIDLNGIVEEKSGLLLEELRLLIEKKQAELEAQIAARNNEAARKELEEQKSKYLDDLNAMQVANEESIKLKEEEVQSIKLQAQREMKKLEEYQEQIANLNLSIKQMQEASEENESKIQQLRTAARKNERASSSRERSDEDQDSCSFLTNPRQSLVQCGTIPTNFFPGFSPLYSDQAGNMYGDTPMGLKRVIRRADGVFIFV